MKLTLSSLSSLLSVAVFTHAILPIQASSPNAFVPAVETFEEVQLNAPTYDHMDSSADVMHRHGVRRRHAPARQTDAINVQRKRRPSTLISGQSSSQSGSTVAFDSWWKDFVAKEALIYRMGELWKYHFQADGSLPEKGHQMIINRIRNSLTLEDANHLMKPDTSQQYIDYILENAVEKFHESDVNRIQRRLRKNHYDLCVDMPAQQYIQYALEQEIMRGLNDEVVMNRVLERILNGPHALDDYEVKKWQHNWV